MSEENGEERHGEKRAEQGYGGGEGSSTLLKASRRSRHQVEEEEGERKAKARVTRDKHSVTYSRAYKFVPRSANQKRGEDMASRAPAVRTSSESNFRRPEINTPKQTSRRR